MQQLWAPWRMPYLDSSGKDPGCIFCVKADENNDRANHIVYRDRLTFVMLNLYPYNSGHLMVVPYRHVGMLTDLDGDSGADLFTKAQLSITALTDVMHPDGFNLGINQGEVAGAGITDHIHLHIVPRWNGDTNFMPVLADAKVMPELLTATADKLRPAFERLAGG